MSIWHKLDGGEFERDGKEYSYVIEQDKGLPIETNTRVRITKVKPVVSKIRTRYEPHIEVDGDADAIVPAYFGYNPSHLSMIIAPLMILGMTAFFITFIINPEFMNNWQFLHWGPVISFPSWIIAVFMIFMVLAFFTIPIMFRVYYKWKLYLKLKKEGLKYEQIKGV